jgi:hypothetical protein
MGTEAERQRGREAESREAERQIESIVVEG